MLPLAEIAAVKATVSEDWTSSVADASGAPWGMQHGALRWWRSSASHVFVAPQGTDERAPFYLRFAPSSSRSGMRLEQGAVLQGQLSDRCFVAPVLLSAEGRAVETVATPLGDMTVMAVKSADGEELDVTDLDVEHARAWGRALGEFHTAAGAVGTPLERTGGFSLPASLAGARDRELAEALLVLEPVAARVGGTRWVCGHGDFELDNLRWRDDSGANPVAQVFDLDEAGAMPLVTDIAAATRGLFAEGTHEVLYPNLLSAFLAGYAEYTGVRADPREIMWARMVMEAQRWAMLAADLTVDHAAVESQGLGPLQASLAHHARIARDLVIHSARSLQALL